jgi:DNA-binding LytR/AlgR family response regulator
MVALRKLAYASVGESYDFGSWWHQAGYEYLKDVRSFAGMVFTIEVYRLLLRRMQGEASLLSAPDDGAPVEALERPDRFLVRKLGREFLVAAIDIEWLQASGNYVNLRVRGHDYPLRSTLAGIGERLDPARFARIHRSYIVNLDQVASIEPLETGDARVHLRDGGVLPCSRRQREVLRDSLLPARAAAG